MGGRLAVVPAAAATALLLSAVGGAPHAGAVTFFVDGSRSPFLTDVRDPPDRMLRAFAGRFADDPDSTVVDYPRTLGVASVLSDGLGAPTYDVSEQVAVDRLVAAVRTTQIGAPSAPIVVVGYSQGAAAVVRALDVLDADPAYSSEAVVAVLAANPRRNDGGVLARLPAGTVPGIGATAGVGTTPQRTTIVQVTKQYDGVADFPRYLGNGLAVLNAVLGYGYLHNGLYADVDLDAAIAGGAVVTRSADGTVVDVLVPTASGALPLTRPLLSLGVSREVVVALDPLLRAVIETGYDRPAPGQASPSAPVGFSVAPPPERWAADARAVAAGAVQTGRALAALSGTPPGSEPVPETAPAASSAGTRSEARHRDDAERTGTARSGTVAETSAEDADDDGADHGADDGAERDGADTGGRAADSGDTSARDTPGPGSGAAANAETRTERSTGGGPDRAD